MFYHSKVLENKINKMVTLTFTNQKYNCYICVTSNSKGLKFSTLNNEASHDTTRLTHHSEIIMLEKIKKRKKTLLGEYPLLAEISNNNLFTDGGPCIYCLKTLFKHYKQIFYRDTFNIYKISLPRLKNVK